MQYVLYSLIILASEEKIFNVYNKVLVKYQWNSTAICFSRYTYICASSLHNLAVPYDFYSSHSVSVWLNIRYGVGLSGFKRRANEFLLA